MLGLFYGGGVMVYAFIKGPGTPGIYELLVQALFVGVFVSLGALVGLLIGWLISLCVRKKETR